MAASAMADAPLDRYNPNLTYEERKRLRKELKSQKVSGELAS